MDEDFKKFLGYVLFFAFVILFWNSFKADMERRNAIPNIAQNKIQNTQKVYKQVYVNNVTGQATIYYIMR